MATDVPVPPPPTTEGTPNGSGRRKPVLIAVAVVTAVVVLGGVVLMAILLRSNVPEVYVADNDTLLVEWDDSIDGGLEALDEAADLRGEATISDDASCWLETTEPDDDNTVETEGRMLCGPILYPESLDGEHFLEVWAQFEPAGDGESTGSGVMPLNPSGPVYLAVRTVGPDPDSHYVHPKGRSLPTEAGMDRPKAPVASEDVTGSPIGPRKVPEGGPISGSVATEGGPVEVTYEGDTELLLTSDDDVVSAPKGKVWHVVSSTNEYDNVQVEVFLGDSDGDAIVTFTSTMRGAHFDESGNYVRPSSTGVILEHPYDLNKGVELDPYILWQKPQELTGSSVEVSCTWTDDSYLGNPGDSCGTDYDFVAKLVPMLGKPDRAALLVEVDNPLGVVPADGSTASISGGQFLIYESGMWALEVDGTFSGGTVSIDPGTTPADGRVFAPFDVTVD